MLPAITQHSSNPFPYRSGMKSGNDALRRTVAQNLRALMEKRAWSQMDLQSKSKVSQRHISNMLNSKTGASFETLSAVGAAFGVPGWMLMIERLPVDLLDSQRIPLLVSHYRDAGPDGRDLLDKQASREAVHNQTQHKVVQLQKPNVR
jgi:transcriptional regulator with XRE-family HTH domain